MEAKSPFVVLVVDDEPPICDMLATVARKTFPEASFVNARSAGEALAYLEAGAAQRPNLILLDIDLKLGVDGLTLLPRLRNVLKDQVPIVMLTTSLAATNVEQAYTRGALAYTQKPNDLSGWRLYVSNLRDYLYGTTFLHSSAPPPQQ